MYSGHPGSISRSASPIYGAGPRPVSPYGAPGGGFGAGMPGQRPVSPYGAPPQTQTVYGNPGPVYNAPVPVRPISRAASPNFAHGGMPDPAHSPVIGFTVEKRARSPNPYGRPPLPQPEYKSEDAIIQEQVGALIGAKTAPFVVSGSIPTDPTNLVLFARSNTGPAITVDFPIDFNVPVPLPLDALLGLCRPHSMPNYNAYGEAPAPALFFPPELQVSTTLEIANFPILDAVKSSLFPTLPPNSHLVAIKERLDAFQTASQLSFHSPARVANDGRVATILVTLPVRFKGGAIVVRNPTTHQEEKFAGTAGKLGDLDWVAISAASEFAVEPVEKGFRLSLSYSVFIKTFGAPLPRPGAMPHPAQIGSEFLVTPTDKFFDLLSPILNISRGKIIAFFLNHDYGLNPAEALANTVVPLLKGGDVILYNAFKMHKLTPEFHYTAGGFIWSKDKTLEDFGDSVPPAPSGFGSRPPAVPPSPYGRAPGAYGAHSPQAPYGVPGGYGKDESSVDILRSRVQASGAVPFVEAGVTLLTDLSPNPTIGKEKVWFVSNGELEKLVVNVLLTVYIP